MSLPEPVFWASFWVVSFAFWRFGLWTYSKIDPSPTYHAGTVWTARILASCSLILIVEFGWRAWYAAVPLAMILSGLVYLFFAKAWVERAYLEDVRDTIEDRMLPNAPAALDADGDDERERSRHKGGREQ